MTEDKKIEDVKKADPVPAQVKLEKNAIYVWCEKHKCILASSEGQSLADDKMLCVEKGQAACKYEKKDAPEFFWPEIQVNIFE